MRVGIALSGGGALGAAHIGVLEAIEASGMPVDLVCGTSAGAIIGLLFAYGGGEAIGAFLQDIADAGLITRPFLLSRGPEHIFTLIAEMLRKRVPVTTFSALSRRFSCVATDISAGDMVVLSDGDPVDAVMASSAYPGVFPAQRREQRWLVDGGVVCNLPAHVIRGQGADFIIGSSLYGLTPLHNPTRATPPSRIQTALRALEVQQHALSEVHMHECDYCFTPPVDAFKWYEFTHLPAIHALGRAYAQEHMGELIARYRQHST